MTIVGSKEQIYPRDKLARWVDEFSATCQVDSEPQRGTRFFGEGSITDIAGGLQIRMGATSARGVARSSRHVARGEGRFFVQLAPTGCLSIGQDGRDERSDEKNLVAAYRKATTEACDSPACSKVVMPPTNVKEQQH